MFEGLRDALEIYNLLWRSRKALKRVQTRKLRALAKYFSDCLPTYQQLLQQAGVTPEEIRTYKDRAGLPIMSKELFLKNPNSFLIAQSAMRGMRRHTSGTSGIPFAFATSALRGDEHLQRLFRFSFLIADGFLPFSVWRARVAQIITIPAQRKHTLSISVAQCSEDPESVLAQMYAFKPDIIEAYPTVMHELARYVAEHPALPHPLPRFITTFGEYLAPEARTTIEKIFRCVVYDRYGIQEFGTVGIECGRHDGFHINASLLIEVVDESGKPLPDGSRGRIVGTDLTNRAMPFIRYDTGDRGSLTSVPCPCGLESPRVWIEGRYAGYLSLRGKKVHYSEFNRVFNEYAHHVFRFQIVQESDAELVARIIPGDAFEKVDLERLRSSLKTVVGSEIAVSVQVVKAIPRFPSGKSQTVVPKQLLDFQ